MIHTITHGPYHIKQLIDSGRVTGLTPEKAAIAADRWQSAIEGAHNAGRPIPILQTIDGEATALIVVDMQNAFLSAGASIEVPGGVHIIPHINWIAAKVRAGGGPVIFLRYLINEEVGLLRYFEGKSYLGREREPPLKALQPGNPQFELYDGLDLKAGDLIIDKIRYSAVLGSNIVEVLSGRGVKNTIITGVTTDVCAGNTAEDLMQKDFHVVMVWDATAAMDRLEHELYLARIFSLYGDVMPTEEVIQRMVRS